VLHVDARAVVTQVARLFVCAWQFAVHHEHHVTRVNGNSRVARGFAACGQAHSWASVYFAPGELAVNHMLEDACVKLAAFFVVKTRNNGWQKQLLTLHCTTKNMAAIGEQPPDVQRKMEETMH